MSGETGVITVSWTELDRVDNMVSDLMTACLRSCLGGKCTHSSIFTVDEVRRAHFFGSTTQPGRKLGCSDKVDLV